ncbi:MAG TPA: hypothetical protein DHW63_13105 [Hyphomonadaceae bacterium]|nr:hypothetical protein [Hyphomonadaceae bacterium]
MSSSGIARAVRTSASRVRSAFALLLRRVADRNGKNRGIDFVARAAHLYAMLNGLSALAATGADRRLINRSIRGAMLQIETDLRGTGTRRK